MTLELRPAFSRMRVRRQWLRERKNCAMLNAKVLVVLFLTYSDQIICVRATPALMVDLNLRPSNWLG